MNTSHYFQNANSNTDLSTQPILEYSLDGMPLILILLENDPPTPPLRKLLPSFG